MWIKGPIGLVVPAVDQPAGARNPSLVPVELHQLEHVAEFGSIASQESLRLHSNQRDFRPPGGELEPQHMHLGPPEETFFVGTELVPPLGVVRLKYVGIGRPQHSKPGQRVRRAAGPGVCATAEIEPTARGVV
jgi:hypothetical protein